MEDNKKRAQLIKATVSAHGGKVPSVKAEPKEGQISAKTIKDNIVMDLKASVKEVDMLRAGGAGRQSVNITWEQFVQKRWGFGNLDSFYKALGVNPSLHSMDSFNTMPEFNENYKWLVPEIVREAVRLGLARSPLYTKLIRSEETISQPTLILPAIAVPNVPVKKLGETESIPTGTIEFGQKSVTLFRVGTGVKVTDQVNTYTPLNILAIYLQEVGVQMGLMYDQMAIDTLINGDQDDLSANAPVIGVETLNTFAYKDLLRSWLRMGRIGRTPTRILSNEDPALEILELPEFKGFAGQTVAPTTLNFDSVIPNVQNYSVHGGMPTADKILLIDTLNALLKINGGALRVEADRIVEKGLNATYVSSTTGFANLFRDARLIVDSSLDFASNGFPSWLNNRESAVNKFRN